MSKSKHQPIDSLPIHCIEITTRHEVRAKDDLAAQHAVMDLMESLRLTKRFVSHSYTMSAENPRTLIKYKVWVVEVIADGSGEWVRNGLRFASESGAKAYGADLAFRWTAVKWRAVEVESDEPANRE